MRRILCATFAALVVGAGPAESTRFSHVRIQVIDVGQADGILIRTPNTRWILIDAGQGTLLADSLPTRFGVDTIHLAIGSHRHKDHIGAMDNVMAAIPTSRYVGDTSSYSRGEDDDNLRAAIGTTIPVARLAADTIMLDGVRIIVLPYGPRAREDEENNNSVVVRMDYGDFSMLFVGDAEAPRRNWLIANHRALLDADVLKASHHGSGNGTSSDWLDAVSPTRIVISAGLNATFRHPRPEAVAAYAARVGASRVYCTNRHGTIRFYGYQDGAMTVSKQRQSTKSCAYDGTLY